LPSTLKLNNRGIGIISMTDCCLLNFEILETQTTNLKNQQKIYFFSQITETSNFKQFALPNYFETTEDQIFKVFTGSPNKIQITNRGSSDEKKHFYPTFSAHWHVKLCWWKFKSQQ
jgi:hypothetical protein